MVLHVETFVCASPAACFDAHRDLGLHARSAAATGEKIVSNRTEGLLELGEEATFEARHFGVLFRLTSKIVAIHRPESFTDEMQAGPFRRLRHEHRFAAENGGTCITDILDFASPFGPVGWLLDRFLIGPHLARFLRRRNAFLRRELEAGPTILER